jgi:predicted amidohydrolase YtcJ
LRFTTEVSWIGATVRRRGDGAHSSRRNLRAAGTWIVVAGGWTPAQFAERRRPTQAELTAAAPGHPVYVQLFYRAVLLTPAGLSAFGIAGDADLPATGKLEHGEDEGWISGDSAAITGLYASFRRRRWTKAWGGRAGSCTS